MTITAKDIIIFVLVVFIASYGIYMRFDISPPPKEDNRLKLKYDSLNVVLGDLRRSNEILLLSLGQKQDTIYALESEIAILKGRRQGVDSLHHMVDVDILIEQVRVWADRYVANNYSISRGVDLVPRTHTSRLDHRGTR